MYIIHADYCLAEFCTASDTWCG